MRTFILVLSVWALGLAAPAWKPFSSPQGHFSAVFPGAPKASSSQTDSPIGAVVTQVFTSTVAVGSYSVACTELPGAAVRFASDQIISDTRQGILQDAGAQQQSWAPLNGGYELAYRSPQKQGWSQIFLVGNRLYVLDARLKPGIDKRQWVTPFFAKFSAQ
ncbi:MAG: hypothetical protein KF760_18810 [Candidatus Eremiobacteraeota bacterium]|nr:hypothetical protein [Candidatus Eremiobacteraeota bacterium]MCW5868450.1 hypothetical protein [Candidatus Eremiobacteraeota bacterium]